MAYRVIRFLRPTLCGLIVFAFVAGVLNAFSPRGDLPSGLVQDPVTELNDLDVSRIVLPKVALAPDEVVNLQLAGLSDQRPDGIGILQCYAFASPANRMITGPLDRFGRMVRGGVFQSMARPRAYLVGRPNIRNRMATVLVTIIDQQDRVQAFTFVLGRQSSPPFADCWMTEAVWPSIPAAKRPGTPAA